MMKVNMCTLNNKLGRYKELHNLNLWVRTIGHSDIVLSAKGQLSNYIIVIQFDNYR